MEPSLTLVPESGSDGLGLLLADLLEDGIVLEQNGTVIYINRCMEDLFGCTSSRVSGMPYTDFIRTCIAPCLDGGEKASISLFSTHVRSTPGEHVELRGTSREGTPFWLEYSSRRIKQGCNGLYRLETYRRITRWKKAQERLSRSEEKYRLLFQQANDAILVFEIGPLMLPGRFLEVNDAACRRLGYTREELSAHSPMDIVPPERVGTIGLLMKRLFIKGQIMFDMEHVARDGTRIPVEVNAHAIMIGDRKVVISISRDVSERRALEDLRLKASEQLEENILQFATLGDRIRNNLGVIVGIAGLLESEEGRRILEQAERIDRTVDQLDRGSLESDLVRQYLKKYHRN
ncbi:PAS domain S-box-containing protein [Methanolinea mesophila]|uniref:PAS domain-containing protein n=1 Tax=Methanolinea mesophila TaxID=547055 RepID=UPI001AEB9EDE|nr:PAS domain S-box protein [Methanolinea mesophila]MBP1927553.1 PAS domain S-box-containing protein [Methanolinea mesophila]